MTERFDDDGPSLPREWLPDPTAPDGAPVWDARARRILAAAHPTLQALATERSMVATPEAGPSGWAVLGSWWKPAAGLAAAAAVAWLVLPTGPADTSDRDSERMFVSVVAAGGDPAALWDGLGIEADPVLAALVLHDPDDE